MLAAVDHDACACPEESALAVGAALGVPASTRMHAACFQQRRCLGRAFLGKAVAH
jgi:hypothetical protein